MLDLGNISFLVPKKHVVERICSVFFHWGLGKRDRGLNLNRLASTKPGAIHVYLSVVRVRLDLDISRERLGPLAEP